MSFMHFVQEKDAGKLSWCAGPASQVSVAGRRGRSRLSSPSYSGDCAVLAAHERIAH